MNLLERFNQQQIKILTENKVIPTFYSGDLLKVYTKITEGATERVQVFEGTCVGRKNRSIGSTFTVKKISHGEGVERTFQLYSPNIEKIELVRKGRVRRAKLYYMRELTGKAARIKEKTSFHNTDKKNNASAQ